MSAPSGRTLALDPGEARIGVALSDPLGLTAQPLEALQRVGPRKDLKRIEALVRENGVTTIIVGLPLLLSGREGTGAAAARAFAHALRKRIAGVRVELWDERLTTVEAERVLLAGRVKRAKRKRSVDSLAAVLILQSYLEARSA